MIKTDLSMESIDFLLLLLPVFHIVKNNYFVLFLLLEL